VKNAVFFCDGCAPKLFTFKGCRMRHIQTH
jgi:hypothetical protein